MEKTFKTAIEMATWINSNVPNELMQETLMQEGITHKRVKGTYTISFD